MPLLKQKDISEDYLTTILEISRLSDSDQGGVRKAISRVQKHSGSIITKSLLLDRYKILKHLGKIELSVNEEKTFYTLIRKKQVRTMSGVTTVTVLTKPYPCPGKCIYCPNDYGMPKSYISSEPGAQRALSNRFDPYPQTFNRLCALNNIGHPTGKVELIVLGGTFTFYPREYQIWFIKRCFEAMNDFHARNDPSNIDPGAYLKESDSHPKLDSKLKSSTTGILCKKLMSELRDAHNNNETAGTRCVGLSLETRPDEITKKSVRHLRQLGATKIQMGVQILDDAVLYKNRRGHGVRIVGRAFMLLRQAGFKIQIHWMPNLYGSTPQNDIRKYHLLFRSRLFKPDEVKIYPCSLIKNTGLEKVYNQGKWVPYPQEKLVEVLKSAVSSTPRYCRISRIIRDIPSDEIEAGNKATNLRQNIEKELIAEGTSITEIRFREIRSSGVKVNINDHIDYRNLRKLVNVTDDGSTHIRYIDDYVNEGIEFNETIYTTSAGEERFLEFVNNGDRVLGFLRLLLPNKVPYIRELEGSAVIREIHVYGLSISVGNPDQNAPQHAGIGRKLMDIAKIITKDMGYNKLSVISAVGTREYYRNNGFTEGDLYQHFNLITQTDSVKLSGKHGKNRAG